MTNRILNITADNTWQTLGPNEGFPNRVYGMTMKARTSAASYLKFDGQTEYVTIPADTDLTLTVKLRPGDVQVMAANDVVLEIMLFTEYPLNA